MEIIQKLIKPNVQSIREDHIKSCGYEMIIPWESDIKQGTFIDILKQYELFKDKIN